MVRSVNSSSRRRKKIDTTRMHSIKIISEYYFEVFVIGFNVTAVIHEYYRHEILICDTTKHDILENENCTLCIYRVLKIKCAASTMKCEYNVVNENTNIPSNKAINAESMIKIFSNN